MRQTARGACVGMVAICLGLVAGTLRAGELPSGLTEKYQPAVDKLKKLYSHATVAATVTREFPQKQETYEQTLLFRAAGVKQRLDIRTTSSKRGGPAVGTVEVYMATPEASFYGIGLKVSPHIDTSNELSYAEAKFRIESAFPVDQPYSLGSGGTVLEMLQKPQITVGSVQKVDHKGKQYVKIVYDEPSGGKSPAESQSYVLLSPSEGWAVREFSKKTGQGASQKIVRGKISYGDMRDGVPVVERIETWEYEGADKRLMMHEVIAISRFTPGDPTSYTFTADAFQ